MVDSTALMLADLHSKYEDRAVSDRFSRLYDQPDFEHMFAVLHEALNVHFAAINGRAETTHHYWAENSREFLALIKEIKEDTHALKRVGIDMVLIDSYRDAIESCEPWLSQSGGSAVPNDFAPIPILRHEPAFSLPTRSVRLKKRQEGIELKMIGEGSYAHVYAYTDPDYDIKFAVKRAKRGLSERDLTRFKKEFDTMKGLSFPYVVQVYKYNADVNEYAMEYCDATLRSFIKTRNSRLAFASRKRVALQFLYGINYIHTKGLLHRDISLQNVLLKVFASGAVTVKLSDFGLVKTESSTFTLSQTEMRGSIRDPQLENFADYATINEVYSMGWVLSYIFTGRESLKTGTDEIGRIIQKCADHDVAARYQSAAELIADVERLEVTSREVAGQA
jgi:hypothetical protein